MNLDKDNCALDHLNLKNLQVVKIQSLEKILLNSTGFRKTLLSGP